MFWTLISDAKTNVPWRLLGEKGYRNITAYRFRCRAATAADVSRILDNFLEYPFHPHYYYVHDAALLSSTILSCCSVKWRSRLEHTPT